MNRRILNTLISVQLIALVSAHVAAHARDAVPTASVSGARTAATLSSGIDLRNMDTSVRPQDDFYAYTNGAWLKDTAIPADKSRWGSFDELRETALVNLRTIIDTIAAQKDKAPGSEAQKIGDLYASYMDSSRIERLGITPLAAELKAIGRLTSAAQLAPTKVTVNAPEKPAAKKVAAKKVVSAAATKTATKTPINAVATKAPAKKIPARKVAPRKA